MFVVRPPVRDLAFRLYDRPLHPELFHTLAVRRACKGETTLTVRLTPTGHVFEYRRPGVTVTEAVAAADDPLPGGELVRLPVGGERRGRRELPGLRYQTGVQAERLPPEVFAHLHDELAADGRRRGLLFHLAPPHRFGLAPLGVAFVEPVPGGLAVNTFHTFPAEHTVVKTQSLFEPR
jgi:hypothetical protein